MKNSFEDRYGQQPKPRTLKRAIDDMAEKRRNDLPALAALDSRVASLYRLGFLVQNTQ